MITYTFIDASNIIYGTRDEGWRVDLKKLFKYLKERYKSRIVYYFAGVEEGNSKQKRFYELLEKIGYRLILKPVKIYSQTGGKKVKKANCDVDLTFYAMRDKGSFSRGIFLTGDGDFKVLLKYLASQKKKVIVIANGRRTAKEIRVLMGSNFTPMKSLRGIIEYRNKNG
ncbi:MAG: NYN domain-containing protein [Patescibacteria group bacterium]|nr:NYN domain-containing protein [Patescibacteria group bacterium]MCL5431702.1 NYN domain-containing protein [Patescibacteria group bacterium]